MGVASARRRINYATMPCKLWIDVSDSSTLFNAVTGGSLPASGGNIHRIEDKSGNGYHLTQATSGLTPKRTVGALGGKDGASFNGARIAATTAADWNFMHNGVEPYLVSMVIKLEPISTSSAGVIYATHELSSGSAPGTSLLHDNRTGIGRTNTILALCSRNSSGTFAFENIGNANIIVPGGYAVLSHLVDTGNVSGPSRSKAYNANSAVSANNTSTLSPSIATAFKPFTIGASNTGVFPMTATLCEMKITTGLYATDQMRQNIKSALQAKWGL